MTKLQEFLIQSDVSAIRKEVKLGGRFGDMAFVVKPVTSAQFTTLQKTCVDVTKKGNQFNAVKFNEQLILTCLVDPNLRDSDMLNKAGCQTPEQLLSKVFLAGELTTLSSAILDISGFGKGIEEDIEDAKNS